MKRHWPLIAIIISILISVILLKDTFQYYSSANKRALVARDSDLSGRIINLGLDLTGGVRMVVEVDCASLLTSESDDVLDRSFVVIQNRVDGLGIKEASVRKQPPNRLIIELPGVHDPELARRIVNIQGMLEFRLVESPERLQLALETIDKVVSDKGFDQSMENR